MDSAPVSFYQLNWFVFEPNRGKTSQKKLKYTQSVIIPSLSLRFSTILTRKPRLELRFLSWSGCSRIEQALSVPTVLQGNVALHQNNFLRRFTEGLIPARGCWWACPSATFAHSSTDLVMRTRSGIDFQAFQHILMTGFQCQSPNTMRTHSQIELKEHNRGVILIIY